MDANIKANNKIIDYKKTLTFPKTNFPMRASLNILEKKIQLFWKEHNIYDKLLKKNLNKPNKIIFDGPPYANGSMHLGTAMNKILKDIYVRWFFLNEYYSEFIYMWDVHGLKIENKVLNYVDKVDISNFSNINIFRSKCLMFAKSQVNLQIKQISKLGMLAVPELNTKKILTSDLEYAKYIQKIYLKAREKKLVNIQRIPIQWSINKQSVVADYDVTYRNVRCSAIYFSYSIINSYEVIGIKKLYFLVFTTAPWTIPGNACLAINKKLNYIIIEYHNKYYILANECLNNFKENLNIEKILFIKKISYSDIITMSYADIYSKNLKRVYNSAHVNDKVGSGVVHIAPFHGMDDYLLMEKLYKTKNIKLKYSAAINKFGNMLHPKFQNSFYTNANDKIINDLFVRKLFIKQFDFIHKYPLEVNSLEPLIYFCIEQKFLSFHNLLPQINKKINSIKFYPNKMQNSLFKIINDRERWCISRQRLWGTPILEIYLKNKFIPFFNKIIQINNFQYLNFDSNNNNEIQSVFSLFCSKTLKYFLKIFEKYTDNIWFSYDFNKLLPKQIISILKEQNFIKKEKILFDKDTLDVWFDSGVALFALKSQYKKIVALSDFILIEGIDQCRGWFNSSLILSEVINSSSFASIIVMHGFVVDENNTKMSKSLGNVINPLFIIKKYGSEILRLWVATNNVFNNVVIGNELLDKIVIKYRKFRNTIRWILGNLNSITIPYNLVKNVLFNKVLNITQYAFKDYDYIILLKLQSLINEYNNALNKFNLHNAYKLIDNFIINDLSANYFNYLKDILYVLPIDNNQVIKSKITLFIIGIVLIKLVSPILPHTCEEWFQYFKKDNDNFAPFKTKKINLSLFELPAINKILINKNIYAKEYLFFYNKILPLLNKILTTKVINNSKLGLKKKVQSFNNVKLFICFKPTMNKSFYTKIIKKSLNIEELIISDSPDCLFKQKDIYYHIAYENDKLLLKEINEIFYSIVILKFENYKCQRCWSHYKKENLKFNTNTKILCNSCHDVLQNSENKKLLDL